MRHLLTDIGFDAIDTPGKYNPKGGGIEGYTSSFENLFSNVLVVLTAVAGLSFTIYFLLGGLNWITAGGKSDKIETAKGMMTNGAIGIIIVVVSYAIVWIVGSALGLPILEPGELINNLSFN